ncbi:MAG: hypothetical protein KAR20_27080, partial [Candidatus Heimdallarchaeota archaeon]|nr:hypothetical protein [Candidatus Heimdallarchaeota archaeon]
MRIYQSCIEAADELKRELKEMGIEYQSDTVQDQYVGDDPDYKTLELMGYSYCIQSFPDLEELLIHLGANPIWAHEEIIERLHPGLENKNPGMAWLESRRFWEPFLRNGCFSYSYAERWSAQLPYVLNELQQRPNTRQAIVSMYESTKDMMNWGGRDRVPCSLTYQFFLRDGYLYIIYGQRSCDFKLFYATDVYFTIHLLQFMAHLLEVKVGSFFHNIGSLHTFAYQVA